MDWGSFMFGVAVGSVVCSAAVVWLLSWCLGGTLEALQGTRTVLDTSNRLLAHFLIEENSGKENE